MTREEARELAKVMIAYADGKDIEHRLYGTNKWATFNGNDKDHHLSFNFSKYAYRIKKKPTYRPFKNKEECWAEMQKHQPFGWVIDKNTMVHHTIVALNSLGPYFSSDCGDDYKHLFECASFADGTPFGIKEE